MRVSTTTSILAHAIESYDPFELIDLLSDSGFSTVDFGLAGKMFKPAIAYGDSLMYSDSWREWCIALKEYSYKRNVSFNQSHNLIFNYFDESEWSEKMIPMLDRMTEATALLGADITVFHPCTVPGREYDRKHNLEINAAFLRERAEFAAQFGVKIAIENMLSTRCFDGSLIMRYCSNIEEVMELVTAIDRPNVGICLDIGHTHYMHQSVYDDVIKCASHLISLHIHDNDQFNDRHLIPYAGTLNWNEFFQALRDIGYEGDFTLEILHAFENTPRTFHPQMLRYIAQLTEWMASQACRE